MTGEIIGELITGLRDGAEIEELNLDGSPLTDPAAAPAPQE